MLKHFTLVVFILLLVLNLFTYRNAIHNELRFDQSDVYQGAELTSFTDRLNYAFKLTSENSAVVPRLLWFRPAAFMVSWQLFLIAHKQPYVINLFNIVFLTLTGFALFRLINHLSGNRWLAFLTSVLFCVHPVTGVWVNYAPGGVHGLLVLAIMLSTLYYFMVFLEDRRNKTALGLSLGFFALGLMFHEIVCFLPFYMAVTIHFIGKNDRASGYTRLIPFGMLIIVYLLLRTAMLGGNGTFGHPLRDINVDFWIYALTLTKVFFLFLAKLLTLQGIVVNWCEPLMKSFSWEWAVVGVLLVCAFAWLMTARKTGVVPWALGLIFVGFLPVCVGGRYALKEGLIYEGHWLYMTTIGFLVLLSWLLMAVVNLQRKWGAALIAGVVIACIVVGGSYNQLYADDLAYALYYRDQAPGFRMSNIFVYEAYFNRYRYDEARVAISAALTATINDYGIYQRLAYMDFLQGNYDSAEKNIRLARNLSSKNPDDLIFLGDVFGKKSEFPNAVAAYQEAIKLDPQSRDAWLGMADAFQAMGQSDEANKIWARLAQ